ncbi:putative Rmd1/YagE family protein [Sedimentibacter acidaminivorans]|jgi:required for meiotic nuclear division protein 1|uniref:Rmd1/YagE family protein n=1 Tax=Sedimentibacter acidaminivorans TaxID=913099 RepID=A0ABS4GAT7_9FIRM|nr:RMD1 family protein [Sedimentibacter acidaminivorans]MBP1924800.1 putative Rmd1/YagE family protein [Sedimentibacter acidaminivorans]
MNKITFYTYKVATRLPLLKISSFFNIKQDTGWKEYVKIDRIEIENILKYSSSKKAVYLYKYGCITFIDFNQNEIYIFLEYLKKIFVELDNKLLSKFNDTHTIYLTSDDTVALWKGSEEQFHYHNKTNDIVASVLAKSIELHKIETELSDVLDSSGKLISYLNKGSLKANTKKVISIIAKCIRFKYRSIESIKILDKPLEFNRTIEARQTFDVMSEYFELKDRYTILSDRMNILDSITGEYFSYRNMQAEKRLLLFEILLLSIFPLLQIISK